MKRFRTRPFQVVLFSLFIVGLVSLSCLVSVPGASPTYVEAVYYRTYPQPGNAGLTGFQFLQLYYHGLFTFVDTNQPSTMTVQQVHDSSAASGLVPNAVPNHTGNYVILGDQIYLNYPPTGTGDVSGRQSSGTYSPARLDLTGADCSRVDYLRYPPGNESPLATATAHPCVPAATSGGQAGAGTPGAQASSAPMPLASGTPGAQAPSASCELGTWRVDTTSYLAWMNAVGNKAPSITFTKIPVPWHDRFTPDGSFAIYFEPGSSLSFDMTATPTGKVVTTEIDYSKGTVAGTFVPLAPDPAFPSLALMSITIAQNSVDVIGVKMNGMTISAVSGRDLPTLVDQSFFKKVGYLCEGDTLHMIPLGRGLPSEGYELFRDEAWQPGGP